MRVIRIAGGALLVAGLVFAAFLWLRGQARIDRCLDAGGAWDAAREQCVGARIGG